MAGPAIVLVLAYILYLASSTLTSQTGFTARVIHSNSIRSQYHNSLHPNGEGGSTGAPMRYSLGSYVLPISICSSQVDWLLFIDTASSITWVQCKPCQCPKKNLEDFNPNDSTTLEKVFSPPFYTSYGDGTQVAGQLVADQVFIPSLMINVSHHYLGYITFGCVHSYRSVVANNKEENGILALGKGFASIITQVPIQKFSYCFAPVERLYGEGLIKFGIHVDILGGSTLLVEVPGQENFYYGNLEGLSVGNKRIPVPERFFKVGPKGSGGFLIDSGSILSQLHESIYKPLESLGDQVIGEPRVDDQDVSPFEACYWASDSELDDVGVTYHFFGGLNVALPSTSLIARDILLEGASQGMMCLTIVPSTNKRNAPILGSYGQKDLNVGFDLVGGKVSMFPTFCRNS